MDVNQYTRSSYLIIACGWLTFAVETIQRAFYRLYIDKHCFKIDVQNGPPN